MARLLLTPLPHPSPLLRGGRTSTARSVFSHFSCKTAVSPPGQNGVLGRPLIALATAIKAALLGNELEARAATAVLPSS